MNKESSMKLIEIINYYKAGIDNKNKKISEFCKLKYNVYIEYAKKYNIEIETFEEKKDNTYDEYIADISNKASIKDKLVLYNEMLKNDMNEKSIIVWANNYKEFILNYKLNEKYMIQYANNLIKNKHLADKYYIKDDFTVEIKKEETLVKKQTSQENTTDELKIVSRKIGRHSKEEKTFLSGFANLMVKRFGMPTNKNIVTLYYLSKIKTSFKYKTLLINILKKYNLNITENGNLIDSEGIVIDSNYADKIMYNDIKTELLNIEEEKNSGLIDKSYKKNKLKLRMLNGNVIVNLKNKFKFKKEKEETIETKDLKKGLGAMK